MGDRIFTVSEPRRLKLLVSLLRQEILDIVRARGNCSAREIALDLGVPHDSIYYHLRKLVKAGLLIQRGKRAAIRRHETCYSIPGDELQIEYDLSSPQSVRILVKVIASLLRATRKDFMSGVNSTRAKVTGKHRNLWGARMTAWLNKEDVAAIGQLLVQIEERLRRSRYGKGKSLHAISWIIAPLENGSTKKGKDTRTNTGMMRKKSM
ncbi:helix-turn-helix domain-containing protein [bacterium]|nr:helix-turn-helix domain-containing protein [bacterium]